MKGRIQDEPSSEGAKIYKSACRMCHGGCGVLVHVEDGKVVKVKGDPESPLNKGKLCPKGAACISFYFGDSHRLIDNNNRQIQVEIGDSH